jgi:hypothetical protein
MGRISRAVLFLAIVSVSAAMAAKAHKARTYILNGYNFSGVHGANAADLEAKLKHHAGARVTQKDIAADKAIITKELEARHLEGQLFLTIAETHGHVWVIYDLLNPDVGRLAGQNFAGASRVPASVLAAATGLKPGDQLTREKMIAARRGIVKAYVQALPGKKVALKCRVQVKHGNKITLNWIIGEPK